MDANDISNSPTTPEALPDKVSMAWMWRHVPVNAWLTLGGILIGAVGVGIAVGRSSLVSDAVGAQSKTVIQEMSPELSKNVEGQLEALASAHAGRMKVLNDAYVAEEAKAADDRLIRSYQDDHKEAAVRMRGAMKEEREAFNAQVEAVRALIRGGQSK